MLKETNKWQPQVEEGEKLLWQGRPANVGIIDPANKVLVYIDFAIALVWVILSLVIYVPSALGDTIGSIVIRTIILDIIPALMVFLPLRDSFELKNSVYYAVTDHRIMVKTKQFQYSMLYHPDTVMKTRSNGTVCIGEAANVKPGRERSVALSRGVLDDQGTCTGIVLYKAAGAKEDMPFFCKG